MLTVLRGGTLPTGDRGTLGHDQAIVVAAAATTTAAASGVPAC
jgi:hypothetical protein